MPAAIAIPAILGAAGVGASVYGAHKAADAAKNAAAVQVASADKAQQFNQQVYGDQKAALAPYQQAGNESLARLMAQHWGTALPPGMSPTGGSSAMLGNAARGFIPQHGPFSPPPQGNPNSLAAMQAGGPMQQPGGGGMPERGPEVPRGGGGLVRVQAPTGEIAMLAPSQVQMALAKGAKVIG